MATVAGLDRVTVVLDAAKSPLPIQDRPRKPTIVQDHPGKSLPPHLHPPDHRGHVWKGFPGCLVGKLSPVCIGLNRHRGSRDAFTEKRKSFKKQGGVASIIDSM